MLKAVTAQIDSPGRSTHSTRTLRPQLAIIKAALTLTLTTHERGNRAGLYTTTTSLHRIREAQFRAHLIDPE
jgi:hypothetical protein